jgi:hypothetical protein
MTNIYLEKIAEMQKVALNAQKAREMAKAVGVIPDPSSNWKYALRNLRDGQGLPLQGQAKREAITRLAGRDIHRESQQMASLQRKGRDVDEVQLIRAGDGTDYHHGLMPASGHLTPVSMATDPLQNQYLQRATSLQAALDPVVSQGNRNRLSLAHVHPGDLDKRPVLRQSIKAEKENYSNISSLVGPIKGVGDVTRRFESPTRISGAMPSGEADFQDAFRHMSKPRRVSTIGSNPHLVEHQEGVWSGDYDKYYAGIEGYQRSLRNAPYSSRLVMPTGGDHAAFDSAYSNVVNPIYNLRENVVGLHKTTVGSNGVPIGKRSVYLDITPRKQK